MTNASQQDAKAGLPLFALLLDFAGAVLIVVAFLEGSANPPGFLPMEYRSLPYLIGLAIIGVLMMIPFIRWSMARARQKREMGE